jgi:ring-1,2-phenylacetyl-CoA epoxidase subunit PaaE
MTRFYPLEVTEIRRETSDSVSIRFQVPADASADFAFRAGQYLTLEHEIDGEAVRRSYSLCAAPEDGELRVAVKEVPNGRFSTFANRTLQVGDVLRGMPPQGRFVLEADASLKRSFVGMAAGSGITPILSQIRHVLFNEPQSIFTLFYVNKTSASIMFKEALQDLKDEFLERFRLFHLLTREPVDAELFHGRLDAARCQSLIDPGMLEVDATDGVYLCGPESMILDCRDVLEGAGLPSNRVHFELFTTSGAAQAEKATAQAEAVGGAQQVAIVLDGITTTVELEGNKSILDAALDAGLDAPYSCLGGVCCTCRAKMTSGKADMDINYALEPKEVEQGFILTCQSHPKGPGPYVVDFDQQ